MFRRRFATGALRRFAIGLLVITFPALIGAGQAGAQSDPTGGLARVAGIALNPGEHSLYSGVIDPVNGYAYFGTTSSSPTYVIKVALGTGDNPPQRIASLQMPSGTSHLVSAGIDVANGYAYFGTASPPGQIVKVALGAGNSPPTLAGILTLPSNVTELNGGDVDAVNGYGYFSSKAGIVKVALGAGSSTPTYLGVSATTSSVGRRVLLDPANGYGYALLLGVPSQIVKFALGSGDAPPSLLGSLTFPVPNGQACVIDTANGYIYSASYAMDPLDYASPGQVAKIAVGAGNSAPTLVGVITIPEHFFSNGVINPAGGYMLIGNDLTYPGSNVVIIALGAGDALPQRLGAIQLRAGTIPWDPSTVPTDETPDFGEIFIQSCGIDIANGYAYFGTDNYPGEVIKVSLPPSAGPITDDLFGLPPALASLPPTRSESRPDPRTPSTATASNGATQNPIPNTQNQTPNTQRPQPRLASSMGNTVQAWGDNVSGELGNGTNASSAAPVAVSGLTGAVAIAGGGLHTLALDAGGNVWAWGDNTYGQIGDGTVVNRAQPVQISGLSGIVAIAAGYWHSLALDSAGNVWGWGSNSLGQLGLGVADSGTHATPVQISGLSGIVAISGGVTHSLALTATGTVLAWGDNGDGEIGDGTNTQRPSPVTVLSLTGVTAIAAGQYHSLALTATGTVMAWGDDSYGELGDGAFVNENAPVAVSGLTGVTAIASGLHNLALKSDGTVWAWGNNGYGELGDGTHCVRNAPVQTLNLTGVTAIATGAHHSLALLPDGSVQAWGYDLDGELGDGGATDRYAPYPVSGLSHVLAISGGGLHSVALLPELVSVSGVVTLSGIVPTASAQTITFQFRPASAAPAFSLTAPIGPSGAFSLSGIPAEAYTVAVKGSKWLQADVALDTSAGSVTNFSATLLPGDINGDNQVDLKDFSLLAQAFGSSAVSANWNANADLNCDGVVDLKDFNLFAEDYGRAGAP